MQQPLMEPVNDEGRAGIVPSRPSSSIASRTSPAQTMLCRRFDMRGWPASKLPRSVGEARRFFFA
jgi:hypothetical protein